MNWQILKRHYSCLGLIFPMTLVVVRDFYPCVWHIYPSDWKCLIWCRLMIPITVPPTTITPRNHSLSVVYFDLSSPSLKMHCYPLLISPTALLPFEDTRVTQWLLFEHMTERGGAFASKPTQFLMKTLYVTKHDLHIYPVNILLPY